MTNFAAAGSESEIEPGHPGRANDFREARLRGIFNKLCQWGATEAVTGHTNQSSKSGIAVKNDAVPRERESTLVHLLNKQTVGAVCALKRINGWRILTINDEGIDLAGADRP